MRGLLCMLRTSELHHPLNPILGGHCSIAVSIPASDGGDPGLIPNNDALYRATLMLHPESSHFAGYTVRSEQEGHSIATSVLEPNTSRSL